MRPLNTQLKYVLFPVLLMLLYGCPYNSDVPLTPSETAVIDRNLVGIWSYKSTNPGDAGIMTISPFNDHELLIVLQEEGQGRREYYRAFTSIIGGSRFLNVQGVGPTFEKKSWFFLNYSISQSELTIRIVEDKLFKNKNISPTALAGFIESHINDKDLYGDENNKALIFTKKSSQADI